MLNWLLVPVYTQYLVPSAYGIVTELYAYVAFLVILYTYGMETAYFRFSTKTEKSEHTIFNLAQTSIFISTILLSTMLIIFSTPVVHYLEYPGKERYVIWFAMILSIDAVSAIPFARLRLEGKARRFALVKLINIFINIGLNLFFIVFCTKIMLEGSGSPLHQFIGSFFNEDQLVDFVFLSNLIANGFVLVLLFDIIFRFRIIIKLHALKQMYQYALPIMIMGLAGVTNEMLSRAVLKKWLPEGFYENYSNQAALGIFGAAYKLSVFMTLAIQAFRYAAEPFFFTKARDLDSKELFSKVMHWFIIFSCLVLLVVSLNLDIIGDLFLRSPSYREGLKIVPVLLLANLFLGIYYNLSIWFKLTDRTFYGTAIAILGALITVIMNYLLIPLIGYMGSALATLVCYFTMSALSHQIGRRFYPVPYQVGRDIFYIFTAAMFTYVGFYPIALIPFNNKVLQIMLIIIFLMIIFLFEKRELLKIFHQLKKNGN